MSSKEPNTDESKRSSPTRRQVIAALGVSGVFAASAAGASTSTSGGLTAGGGAMSNELSHLSIDWSEGPESELPSAGTEGRFFRVTSGGSNWSTNDVLRDDGTSWSKVDANYGSLGADKIHTVPAGTPADINTALNSYDVVILEEGSTYTGSTTINVESDSPNADGDTVVIAHGATIDYTGSGVAVDVPTNNSSTPGDAYEGRVRWVGGRLLGPGSGTAGSVGVRLTDHFHADIEFSYIEDFETGIYQRNDSAWSEANKWTVRDIAGCGTSFLAEGATTTGGSGTDSMKRSKLNLTAHVPDGDIGVDLQDAGMYAAEMSLTLFNGGASSTAMRIDGGDLGGAQIKYEVDGGSGTSIELVGYSNAPLFYELKDNSGGITTNGNAMPILTPTGTSSSGRVAIKDGDTFLAEFSATGGGGLTFHDGIFDLFNDGRLGIGGTNPAITDPSGNRKINLEGGTGGYQPPPQDLSTISASDGYIYNHDGSNSISADGGTTSAQGIYVWSSTDSEFKTVVTY